MHKSLSISLNKSIYLSRTSYKSRTELIIDWKINDGIENLLLLGEKLEDVYKNIKNINMTKSTKDIRNGKTNIDSKLNLLFNKGNNTIKYHKIYKNDEISYNEIEIYINYEFDNNNRLIKKIASKTVEGQHSTREVLFFYNRMGQLKQSQSINRSNQNHETDYIILMTSKYYYDFSGNLVWINIYDSHNVLNGKVEFKYNNGELIEERIYGHNEWNYLNIILLKYIKYDIDKHQVVIDEVEKHSTDIKKFDKNGNLIEEYSGNLEDGWSEYKQDMTYYSTRHKYVYDDQNNLICEDIYRGNSLISRLENVYNINREILEVNFKNNENKIIKKKKYEYEYDNNNNWIKITETLSNEFNEPIQIRTYQRDIEYFY